MHEEGMTYTITTPHGQTDFIYADSMWDAYTEAVANYGEAVTIRLSWYGEWKCGTEELGACYYDKFGVHHKRENAKGGPVAPSEVTNA